MLKLEGLRPAPAEYYSRIATDEQVSTALTSIIDKFVRSIKRPVRLMSLLPHQIFDIEGGTETSVLKDLEYNTVGEIEHKRLQRLALEAMEAYGFDSESSQLVREEQKRGNTTRETRWFPSQTIPGLVFERIHVYMTDTQEPVHITWNVRDEAPDIRLHFLSLIKKNSN